MGAGGMTSTPAQLLQTGLLFYRSTKQLGGGGGAWVGGMSGKTRSTAADQPALLPDYKVTWFWGGGLGGGMISISAQLFYRITK